MLFGFLSILLMVLLVSLAENWLGARAWKAYVAKAKANGEWFEAKDLIPAPVPDQENFASIPFFKPLLDYSLVPDPNGWGQIQEWRDPQGKKRLDEIKLCGTSSSFSDHTDWRKGEFPNIAAWQQFFRSQKDTPLNGPLGNPGEEVLRVLEKFSPDLDALRLAAARPHSRFPIDYQDSISPRMEPLSLLQRLSPILRLRESAKLSLGKSDAAFEDQMLQLRLIEATETEPFLIPLLVRTAQMEMALSGIWEGIEKHAWSDDQLAKFDSTLARVDMIAGIQKGIRAERILFSFPIIDRIQAGSKADFLALSSVATGDRPRGTLTSTTSLSAAWLILTPFIHGWMDFNKVAIGEIGERYCRVADPKQHRFYPELAAETAAYTHSQFRGMRKFNMTFAGIITPVYERLLQKSAAIQSTVDLARVAIALERHWLVKADYPDSLADLSVYLPQVPNDLTTGQPLHYRKDGKESFLLYSVGWNGKDDGGTTLWNSMKTRPNWAEGDWVWPKASAKSDSKG